MKKIVFLLAITLVAFGCNDPGGTQHITVIGENAATIQALMSLGGRYESDHKNIKIDFKPNTFEDAFTKSNQDFANGTGLYDVVLQYNFALSSYARNHYVYTPDEIEKKVIDSLKGFEKDIFPNAWMESGYYYKVPQDTAAGVAKVGYPVAANSMLLMYNKDLFNDPVQKAAFKKKYGKDLKIPVTWTDFMQDADFFTQPDKNLHGVCLEGASGGWLYYEFVNFLFGMGGKVMDKQHGWQGDQHTRVLLNSPEAVKALQFYTSLKPYNTGNFSNVEQSEQMKLLKAGKTAMGIVWSDVLYQAVNSTPDFSSHFGFAPVPGNVSILSGCSVFVSRVSKHPQEAFDYVIDLMQPQTQIALARKGLCSPLITAYDDPQVQRLPYTAALKSSLLRGSYTLEAGPDATMISDKMTTYIQKAWNGELSPQQALDALQTEVVSARTKIFQQIK
jgi:ABC-type glycerol-3-phosphate transport system substrate-binding protein